MSLSNTAVPKYYRQFRDRVLAGEQPVCREISMEMNRIDSLIRSPMYYYDDKAIDGWVAFCENELTLRDGRPLKLLDSFKLWAEELYGWYYFVEKSVYVPGKGGKPGHYERRTIKRRLTKKQYIVLARGGSKSMYDSCHQQYALNVNTATTQQITTAPTMKQAEEVLSPMRTAITRAPGPLYKFLTTGSLQNTTGAKMNRTHLASTKKGIENFFTGSICEIRPMSIDKLQGLCPYLSTVDEWLSGDIREDVIGAIEQGASKLDDYIIIATSSEGCVRNGAGDTIKMELLDILKGEYKAPHISIWYYRLDDISEVNYPELWVKANPNIGMTVSYEAYQEDVERAEKVPSVRNDILAKRFGIPSEGYTYYFTYEETLRHKRREFWQMSCSMGVDLSHGDDFCAFTFLFPLRGETFGVKSRAYIASNTLMNLSGGMRNKYDELIDEGTLIVFEGTVLDLENVYDDLVRHIEMCEYNVECIGYDPWGAREFIQKWEKENGALGIEKVPQGKRTESIPLGELKKLAADRRLLFDEKLMEFCMGNCITLEDVNGNRMLYKRKHDEKIDNVAAMLDAFVAYKVNKDLF